MSIDPNVRAYALGYAAEPDEDYPVAFCPACNSPREWVECDACGGEGYFDWETLQEEDPLWYGPGDTEPCEQCSGRGGWWWCVACAEGGDNE